MTQPVMTAAIAALVTALGAGCSERHAAAPPSPVDNLIVTINDEPFTLTNGFAEKPAGPGSAGTNTVRTVGPPVNGDITGDGKPDAALLLRNDPGGSGTFYYAVVAVNDGGSWWATNTLPLGDRIAPEEVTFDGGQFRYRFRERQPDEPAAAEPSVEKVVAVRFDPKSLTISDGG